MKSFYGLIGVELEEWFNSFIRNEFEFENYFPSPGQIELQILDPDINPGHHLEIDGILLIHKTCILLEYTGQAGNFRDKIKKFVRNSNIFITSTCLSLKQKFQLFNIPAEKIEDFEEVEHWKFLYIGTHIEFDNRHYSRGDFPDYPYVRDRLYIFQPSQLEYLRQLTTLIGKFSRNELLAVLEFSPLDLGDADESLRLDFIKADAKYITVDSDTKADIYLIKFPIDQLLKIARVSRYEGIPFILEGNKSIDNYQRLLINDKLNDISHRFIDNNKRKTFPNTITIALSNECIEVGEIGNKKLEIPKKYSSIDIIDGQHRLFGYTQSNVSDEVRQSAEILASAIKFKTEDQHIISKSAAKVFCEINSTQAQVSKDLLYLIKYDVLGDRDYIALAGKVIIECERRNRALGGIFLISSLKSKNKLNLPFIAITNIIDYELIPLLMGDGLDGYDANDEDFKRVFNNTKSFYLINPEEFCNNAVILLERYFSYIKSTFENDWVINAESNLITEEYFIAFIRFLRFNLFNKGRSIDDLRNILLDLKNDVNTITFPNDSPSFPKVHNRIPSPTEGAKIIFDFFINLDSFKNNQD
ncbi:DGQHR domain-containing protein [Rhodocytophaga rosea]|uniref:DGQHR domain-containing protein n=1 Tax=Rhodocytophaga rosea TaxID=2704465 RepID=A0A6C0GM63_9BACT|nr:DGQHR domain-containing protein [Rhodocytophaga rosea]QHT68702.1 DGQHR domain-containing protein [Rhodocytophaga rosea]